MGLITSSITKYSAFQWWRMPPPPPHLILNVSWEVVSKTQFFIHFQWGGRLSYISWSLLISFSGESIASAVEEEWTNRSENSSRKCEGASGIELPQAETALTHCHLHAGGYWYKGQTPALWLLAWIFTCGGSGHCLWTLSLCLYLGNSLWI